MYVCVCVRMHTSTHTQITKLKTFYTIVAQTRHDLPSCTFKIVVQFVQHIHNCTTGLQHFLPHKKSDIFIFKFYMQVRVNSFPSVSSLNVKEWQNLSTMSRDGISNWRPNQRSCRLDLQFSLHATQISAIWAGFPLSKPTGLFLAHPCFSLLKGMQRMFLIPQFKATAIYNLGKSFRF